MSRGEHVTNNSDADPRFRERNGTITAERHDESSNGYHVQQPRGPVAPLRKAKCLRRGVSAARYRQRGEAHRDEDNENRDGRKNVDDEDDGVGN